MRYVSLSGGVDSTGLAIYLSEKGEDFELVFADTGAELPETYWIIPRIARQLGRRLRVVSNGTFFQHLLRRNFFLPSMHGRWCTKELKMQPLVAMGAEELLVGIRADEDHRMPDAHRPLVDAERPEDVRLKDCRTCLHPAYQVRLEAAEARVAELERVGRMLTRAWATFLAAESNLVDPLGDKEEAWRMIRSGVKEGLAALAAARALGLDQETPSD
jgi:hypothetical protein